MFDIMHAFYKLKNWWISVMPSIGLAPVVEEKPLESLRDIKFDEDVQQW